MQEGSLGFLKPGESLCWRPDAAVWSWVGTVHRVDSASVSPAPCWSLIVSCLLQARLWWQWTLATTRPQGAAPAPLAITGTQTASAAAAIWSALRASEPSIPVRHGSVCICMRLCAQAHMYLLSYRALSLTSAQRLPGICHGSVKGAQELGCL